MVLIRVITLRVCLKSINSEYTIPIGQNGGNSLSTGLYLANIYLYIYKTSN
jgi:hypothetical protein